MGSFIESAAYLVPILSGGVAFLDIVHKVIRGLEDPSLAIQYASLYESLAGICGGRPACCTDQQVSESDALAKVRVRAFREANKVATSDERHARILAANAWTLSAIICAAIVMGEALIFNYFLKVNLDGYFQIVGSISMLAIVAGVIADLVGGCMHRQKDKGRAK